MVSPRSLMVMLAACTACAGGPDVSDPVAVLALAQSRLAADDAVGANELLEALDEETFVGQNLETYRYLTALSRYRIGDAWDAFQMIRDFADDHAFSDLSREVQDLEYAIGSELIQSDGGFLFFTADADDGQVVLRHFVLRYPTHRASADALRLLGEKAYSEGDFQLAQQRFGDLVLRHENSEWVTLAHFRIAMSSYNSLVGPSYDLRAMRRAENELAAFLVRRVENPTFVEDARLALAQVREWLAAKHVEIADFYHTIGNPRGLHYHLSAAAKEFPNTAAGREAALRMTRAISPESTGSRP